jgi:TetR/AcrR family transcriptional regulator, transcriptional repressor of bet genes
MPGRTRKPRFERQLADARRQALIEAAIASLKRAGHEGLSVRNIAAEAGVSLGLINHHFPNKEALVAEAYRHFHRQLFDVHTQAVARAKPTAHGRLRAFLESTFSPPNLDRDVLTAWVVFWGMLRHSKEIQRVHDETYGDYVDLVRSMLAGLAAEVGRLRMSLRTAAIGLTALLDGLWLEWCLDPEHFSPREAIRICEAWIDNLVPAPARSRLRKAAGA